MSTINRVMAGIGWFVSALITFKIMVAYYHTFFGSL